MSKNKIKQVDSQRSTEISLVPIHPIVMPCVGSVAFGKTSLLIHVMLNKDIYFQKFHRIIFISITHNIDEKVAKILESPDICLSSQALQDESDEEYEAIKLSKFHG